VAADRPEAAQLLERSLDDLRNLLGDRGLDLGGVDVAYRDGGGNGEPGAPGERTGRDAVAPTGPAVDAADDAEAPAAARVLPDAHDGTLDLLA
jgi:hypothetical protein